MICPVCKKRTLETRMISNIPSLEKYKIFCSIKKCQFKTCEITIPYFSHFLNNYKRNTYNSFRNKIFSIAIWMFKNQSIEDFSKAKYDNFYSYFLEIDKKNIYEECKNQDRSRLNEYFRYIEERHRAEGKTFVFPIPSRRGFRFTKTKDRQRTFDTKFLEYPTIDRVLKYYYFTNYKLFIMTALEAYTGFRPSELTTILIKDIKLEEREIISGRTIGKKELVISFFPEFFTKYLEIYINSLKTEFLFPNEKKSSKGYLTPDKFNKKLQKVKKILDINIPLNPYAFRKALNAGRKLMNIQKEDRELLLNHKSRDVNMAHYLTRFQNSKELRKLYDKYFPYPEFKPT